MLFWSNIIVKLYKSQLTSVLTVPREPKFPFETLNQLVPLLEKGMFRLINPVAGAHMVINGTAGLDERQVCVDMACPRMQRAIRAHPPLQKAPIALHDDSTFVKVHVSTNG